MRKISVVISLVVLVLSSCLKDTTSTSNCSPVTITAPVAEVDSLRAYIQNNGITATEDPRGFFYQINTAGDTKPTVCDVVTVNYVGKLTNGNQFDDGSNISFSLSRLIVGWQEGIPLIGTGGSIKLYLPPSLGYGSQDNGAIPGNSILIFDITLLSVN